MSVLLQILKMLNAKQRTLFISLFTDWEAEANELGYTSPEDLGDFVNDCMFNHLGFSVDDSSQLSRLVEVLRKPESVKAALAVVKMK